MTNLKQSIFALSMAVASIVGPSVAMADGIPCKPTDVFENTAGSVYVHCAATQNGISYIAVSQANTARADRFVEMATAALLSGLTFFAWTDDNAVNNPPGCNAAGCRGATQWGLQK